MKVKVGRDDYQRVKWKVKSKKVKNEKWKESEYIYIDINTV